MSSLFQAKIEKRRKGVRKPLMIDKEQNTENSDMPLRLCSCKVSKTSLSSHHSAKNKEKLQRCRCSQKVHKCSDFEVCLDRTDKTISDIDNQGNTALHTASENGDIDLVQKLLSLKVVDVNIRNAYGMTALAYAVSCSHYTCAKLLLENRADPNIPDNFGRTAIFASIIAGSISFTRLLINYGANTNVSDIYGNTPILLAVEQTPSLPHVQLLMQSGANPLIRNQRMIPFLEMVLSCTSLEVLNLVKYLVTFGININIVEAKSQRNCLHMSAINGFVPLGEYLVNNGADLERQDQSRRRPHEVAAEHKNHVISLFFQRAMLLRRIIFKKRLEQKRKEKVLREAVFVTDDRIPQSD